MEQPTTKSVQSAATKDGLGGLERELHATFQASRLPARQKQEHALVAQISNACEDHSPEGVPFVMNPLVVLGPPGSGKSTIVAAWLAKRRAAENASSGSTRHSPRSSSSSTSSGVPDKVSW